MTSIFAPILTKMTNVGHPGVVIMGGDSYSGGRGFQWMDMTFFTMICCKNCIVCLKRPNINEKEPGMAYFLKKNTNVFGVTILNDFLHQITKLNMRK